MFLSASLEMFRGTLDLGRSSRTEFELQSLRDYSRLMKQHPTDADARLQLRPPQMSPHSALIRVE